ARTTTAAPPLSSAHMAAAALCQDCGRPALSCVHTCPRGCRVDACMSSHRTASLHLHTMLSVPSKNQLHPLHLLGFFLQWSHCLLHMLYLGICVCADGCIFYELICSLSKGNVQQLILRTRGRYKSSFPQRVYLQNTLKIIRGFFLKHKGGLQH